MNSYIVHRKFLGAFRFFFQITCMSLGDSIMKINMLINSRTQEGIFTWEGLLTVFAGQEGLNLDFKSLQ